VRDAGDDPPRAAIARGMSRAYERCARADEIVDDYSDGPRDVTSEKVAGDDAGAAMLFRECFADRPARGRLQRFAEQVARGAG
jgi:hypothetical protein